MEILAFINNYWAVISAVVLLIALGARYEYKNDTMDRRITKTEDRLDKVEDKHDSLREEIKVDIKEIKTTMSFIAKAIDEMKSK